MRILSLLLVAAVATQSTNDILKLKQEAEMDTQFIEKFEEFIQKFGKQYSPMETIRRLKNFVANLVRMAEHAAADPTATYSHLTPLADWSEEEFKARNTFKPEYFKHANKVTLQVGTLADSLDWRTKGAVQKVKDQAQCGSCWAFSTVSNIESARVVQANGELVSLSEQELVDCSSSDDGCNGGLQPRAYQDMIDGGWGLAFEADYPYHATDGSCRQAEMTSQVSVQSWTSIQSSDDQIKAALAQYGPLAIGLNATPMQFYFGGVSDPADCDPFEVDHAVNIVGYGTDGKDYWIIRNSWGVSWGEKGYYRLVRGKNACGVNDNVVSATYSSNTNTIVV